MLTASKTPRSDLSTMVSKYSCVCIDNLPELLLMVVRLCWDPDEGVRTAHPSELTALLFRNIFTVSEQQNVKMARSQNS